LAPAETTLILFLGKADPTKGVRLIIIVMADKKAKKAEIRQRISGDSF